MNRIEETLVWHGQVPYAGGWGAAARGAGAASCGSWGAARGPPPPPPPQRWREWAHAALRMDRSPTDPGNDYS